MRLIPFFLVLFFAASCVTQRRCYEKFPPKVSSDTSYYEIVRDSLVYRDSTVTVEIPGETLIDTLYIPSKGKNIHSDTLILETEYARAEAYYKTPVIHLKLEQKDIHFKVKLDSVIRLETHWKEMYTNVVNDTETEIKYIPVIYKIALWMWAGVIALLLFRIVAGKFKLY